MAQKPQEQSTPEDEGDEASGLPARTPASAFRWQRLGEIVAAELRERILSGDLADGTILPKEDDLREVYPVSKPSIREALRILEAEGLLSVRRGNLGGAIVHRPTATNVAYAMAMVLRTENVKIEDVALALQETEPACAALCAKRPDRLDEVIPPLRALHEAALRQIDDLSAVVALSRSFHEELVAVCGNGALIVIVGALEAIWSTHETSWSRSRNVGMVQMHERREALDAHEELIEAIARGDASSARRLAALHLQAVQPYPSPTHRAVVPELIRDHLATQH